MRAFCWTLTLFLSLTWAAGAVGQDELFERFGPDDGLPDNQVNDVCLGPRGDVWVATAKGLSRFNGLSFVNYLENQGPISHLWCTENALWCSSQEPVIYAWQDQAFTPRLDAATLGAQGLSGPLNPWLAELTGTLWLTAPGQIWRSNASGDLEAVPLDTGTYRFFVRQVAADHYLTGTRPEVLQPRLRVQLSGLSFDLPLSSEAGDAAPRFAALRDGSFLFAHGNEVLRFDRATVLARRFVDQPVTRLLADQAGRIWVGLASGGLLCFPDGQLNGSGELRYLSQQTITGLAEDGTGNMYLGTATEGLWLLPARPEITYTAPAVYSTIDSTTPTISATPTELPGPDGLVNPGITTTFRVDTLPPLIYITGIRVDNRDTTLQSQIELDHDFHFVTIRYAGFSTGNTDQVQYRYRLQGFSDSWNYTNGTEAQFTSLDPGTYNFEVLATSKYGIWSPRPALVTLVVHPPYWQTWWFQLSAAAAILSLLGGGFLLYSRQVRSKERRKAAVEKRIAEVELQALRARMNPHFLFNTLSSIQHYITLNETEAALRYLSKFAKLMRRIIDNSKSAMIPLQDELDTLDLYLQLEALRFQDRFSYRIEKSPDLDGHYDTIPSMLIQPYVENAILHGFMHKRGPGHLSINLQREGDVLVCVVEDDGIGREAARARAQKRTHRSAGLSITQERLEILNTARNSALSVSIEDLKTPEGEAAGTRVTLHIPLPT